MGRSRMAATSRDPDEWARATEAARVTRRQVAHEVSQTIAVQVEELIVSGDRMGGRSGIAARLRAVAEAERRQDEAVLRAAVMELCVESGAWVAALDFRPPPATSNGTADAGRQPV